MEQLSGDCISNIVLKGMAEGDYPKGSFVYERNMPHVETCTVPGQFNCKARYTDFVSASVNEEARVKLSSRGGLFRFFRR